MNMVERGLRKTLIAKGAITWPSADSHFVVWEIYIELVAVLLDK